MEVVELVYSVLVERLTPVGGLPLGRQNGLVRVPEEHRGIILFGGDGGIILFGDPNCGTSADCSDNSGASAIGVLGSVMIEFCVFGGFGGSGAGKYWSISVLGHAGKICFRNL